MAAKSAELLHRQLVTARTLEEVCTERLSHWYAALGEEAAVVGTFSALTEGDIAVPHYRGSLAVFWLRGLPMVEVLAALLAKEGSTIGAHQLLPSALAGSGAKRLLMKARTCSSSGVRGASRVSKAASGPSTRRIRVAT